MLLTVIIINYSIIILRFEWKIGKFEYTQTFKHYKILIMASKKERKHDLKDIKNYCRTKIFPKRMAGKGIKANFRWTAKCFSIKNGQLYYKESRRVIADKDRQVDIIHDIHEGLGDTSHSKAMSAHFGRTPTYEKLAARFFWYGIYNDVTDYIKKCDRCQRQNSFPPKVKSEMHIVPVSPHVMKQVALDLCLLPRWMAIAILLSPLIISPNGLRQIQSEIRQLWR